MKIRKRILLLVLMLVLSSILAACGNSPSTESPSVADKTEVVLEVQPAEETGNGESNKSTKEQAETESEDLETAGNGKILIAYFSHTGNTEKAAQKIAECTGADLAEIQRIEEYGDLQEEAEVEIFDSVHPEITVSVDSVAAYDTIFVGYPIWWDEAPAMIATFLAENDFAGKTLIPFCTSSSDDIGNSLHIFSELCPDAKIAEGLTANDLNDIEPWIQRLGLLRR